MTGCSTRLVAEPTLVSRATGSTVPAGIVISRNLSSAEIAASTVLAVPVGAAAAVASVVGAGAVSARAHGVITTAPESTAMVRSRMSEVLLIMDGSSAKGSPPVEVAQMIV